MINRIVITGGPCAGKSSALLRVKAEFEDLGWKVIIINETATEIIMSGVTPAECPIIDFQKQLLQLQMKKEECFFNYAKVLEERYGKVLIVCDRGAMDSKSYITDEEFEEIRKNSGYCRVELRDRYDAVFHLVSAADGAGEFYTIENNSARTETPEEAVKCDRRLISAWCGHPHLRVIDNSTDFNAKIDRLIAEIKAFLGEPKPLEIEKKYLIKYPDINYLNSLDNCHRVEIEQKYCEENGHRFRVRKRGEDGEFVYFKTEKQQVSDLVRIEVEDRITKAEYENAFAKNGIIAKDRYCLVYNGSYFEIDVYPFWNDKAVMEIELISENEQYTVPDFIEIIEDVTGNTHYNNSYLAMMNKG